MKLKWKWWEADQAPDDPVRKKWVIDPGSQTLTERHEVPLDQLISEVIGDGNSPICLKLDEVADLWCTDINTPGLKLGYYLEYMVDPWSTRQLSPGIVVSRGPNFWDENTILHYLTFYDKSKDPFGFINL